ncbi:MAG TPA: hypothetical protein PLT68_12180 [Actinomycetota bacterium]|nr:hypothetical protein [Actinomycetota bacterium]
MKKLPLGVAIGVGLLGAGPAAAEPVPLDQGVAELNAVCVASREAFLQGGTVRLQLRPQGPDVQIQRYDPVLGRVSDSGWPSVTQRGVGTYDRSGFVSDARLRKAQVRQAARYLGFAQRPWVLTRDQFGVIASRSFRQFLRMDLLAPDRFVDLDSATVPAQPQRCASHLLAARARASIDRVTDMNGTTWTLSYRLDDGGTSARVTSTLSVRDGLLTSGSALLRSGNGLGSDLDNFAQWRYVRPDVGLPRRARVVGQRQWIRATDAAVLVTDLRYLAGSLEGRSTLAGLRSAARQRVTAANRGHEIAIRVRNVPRGVRLSGRNPYTDTTVAFDVVIEPKPTAVSRRVS